MKFDKIMLGILGAAAVVSTASANTEIYLYGSTAYRKATYVSIGNLFGANAVTVNYDKASAFGATPTFATTTDKTGASAAVGATNLVWTGTIASGTLAGQTVDIYCNWAGSVGGIKSVAAVPKVAVGSFIQLPGLTEAAHTADIAMSDAYQLETPAAGFVPGFQACPDTIVSVLEFLWAKNISSPASILNINSWTVRSAMLGGQVDLSQMTGNVADIGKAVFLTGRDDDSGTRIIGQLDATFNPSLPVVQYNVLDASDIAYFGVGDGNGGGYSSGGSVEGALAQAMSGTVNVTDPFGGVTPTTGLGIVGYVAISDGVAGFVASPAPIGSRTFADYTYTGKLAQTQFLNYNGVTYSEAAINNGEYTYFGVEHCLTTPGASATITGFKSDLTGQQINEAGLVVPGTEPLNKLNISRSFDGQDVTHN